VGVPYLERIEGPLHEIEAAGDGVVTLGKLNCGPNFSDPLLGNDDTTKPLVACDQQGQAKYVLGPSFLDGTQISDATSGVDPNGAGYVRTEFANNYIDPSRFDPVAAKLLSLYPKPNLSGSNNFFSTQREQVDNDQYIGRFDHRNQSFCLDHTKRFLH